MTTRNQLPNQNSDVLPCSLTATLDVLENSLRRSALRCLAEHEYTISLSELAAFSADDDSVSERDLELIAISLHHTHLPQLEDCGFIHYDPRSNTVERTVDESAMKTIVDLSLDR
ncbi:DUF7344 domain-containing protein [Haladaptatus sp. NG-SE-30]